MTDRKEPGDQQDVLARKGPALKSDRGLQIWGDMGDEGTSGGDAAQGTAERSAELKRRQTGEEG
ncbi:MAG TPA: hypothetical protein VHH36_04155 [Candidatus Thermoplasmatota archaeon]|nr:hypothetical protein [Candidatus Thermoplasmatota archaeon]